MMTAALMLLIIGLLMVVVGAIAKNDIILMVGVVAFAVGLFGGMGIKVYNANETRNDRERRTIVVTDMVLETHHTWTKENGCVQSIKLNHMPYTFECECDLLVQYSISPPKVGDVMRVKFVRPKLEDGKPEVLEVYNLTQEIERVRSAPPSASEPTPTKQSQ